MKRNHIHYLGLLGIVAFISYCIAITCTTFAYPSYNWMTQAVSDLFASDAPSVSLWNQLSSIYSACTIVCVSGVAVGVEDKLNKTLRIAIYIFAIMNWISYIGYEIFPLSSSGYMGQFQDIMHTYVVTALVVGCTIVSLVLFILGGLRDKQYKSLAYWALGSLIFMMIGSFGVAMFPSSLFGVFERFSVLSATFFTAVLGYYFYKKF